MRPVDLSAFRHAFITTALERGDPDPQESWRTAEAAWRRLAGAEEEADRPSSPAARPTVQEPTPDEERRIELKAIACDRRIAQRYAALFALPEEEVAQAMGQMELEDAALPLIGLLASRQVAKRLQFSQNQALVSDIVLSNNTHHRAQADELQQVSVAHCRTLDAASIFDIPGALFRFAHQMNRTRQSAIRAISNKWRSIIAAK